MLFITACQPSATSERTVDELKAGQSTNTDSLEDTSLSQITLLAQQIEQVRQLQEQFRKDLDSLYALDTIVQNQTDTLESIYFALTDAETAWIVLRTQYPAQFDSVDLDTDTTQSENFEASLETVQRALKGGIERAERWNSMQPK
ncbi:hypothetical protein [Tunicatimonas pelagia]|uniref:hypothetical protein n=1 Tax=Tunicatimonas pelagia TaxID=931531 RepID=UPI00266617E9|nr:hypothetical protein [Tunicatimonas pelagia]WKN42308.1 hypothetical protein P0M28_25055 [Tunicatimonas pelagia]